MARPTFDELFMLMTKLAAVRSTHQQAQVREDRVNNFYIYYLRRPDKPDPFDSSKGQPFYVGKGCNGRLKEHRKEAKSLLHKPGQKKARISIIHKLWKHGLDFQEDTYLDDLSEEDALAIEIAAIEQYGRIDLGTGCLANLTDGGEGTINISPETRQKLIDSHKGYKHTKEQKEKISKGNKGKVFTEERRRKIKEAKMGHPVSQETREKIKKANKGRPNLFLKGKKLTKEHKEKLSKAKIGKPSHMLGKHHNEETKEKLRQANLGKKMSPESIEKMRMAQKGKIMSEEAKEKLRIAAIGRPGSRLGAITSEETKEKMRQTWAKKRLLRLSGELNN